MSITAEKVLASASRWSLNDVAVPIAAKLASYGNLLQQWNARLSLTSIRDADELLERHLMEGLFAAKHHPTAATVLDFGSGTGIPGIPIALCHPRMHVTLAESQRKKAAFLQEAVRVLALGATVHSGRAEILPSRSFNAVWMRAVDNSAAMLPLAAGLVSAPGSLCLMTTEQASSEASALLGSGWRHASYSFPGQTSRVLHIAKRH